MFSAERYRRILSGQERTVTALLWRTLFASVQPFYALGVARKNRFYDRHEGFRAGVPVYSVGNLTLGGTGKTPLVRWLAEHFLAQGKRVAILSRGYHADADGWNDEARELHSLVPGAILLCNPDRIASARRAVEEFHTEVILLDDGFQHRRLHRDFDWVLLDATEPLGPGERLFPRGTLREPVDSLRRADGIFLTRANLVSEEERAALRQRFFTDFPRKETAFWAETAVRPIGIESNEGLLLPLESFAGKRLGAFCGIGNPQAFCRTLDEAGLTVESRIRTFPDHHRYSETDWRELARWATEERLDALLCTGKDRVKIPHSTLGEVPVGTVRTELVFLTGLPRFPEV